MVGSKSFIILFAFVFATDKSILRPLKLGKNPPGFLYYLPEGARWNGRGVFDEDHYLPQLDHEEQCKMNGGIKYCVREASRYIQVDSGGMTYPSHCWFADCYVKLKFPPRGWPLVNIFDITDDPIIDFNLPPFYPQGECFGTNATVLAPGWFYRQLELYQIFLIVNLEVRVAFGNRTTLTQTFQVVSLSVAQDGACDAFVSHRLT